MFLHYVLSASLFILLMADLVQAAGYSKAEIRAVETDRDQQLRQLHESEIQQLRIALGRRSPKNRRAEFYFRLAEIYFESYQMMFILEGRAHEKRIARGKKQKKIDRSRSRPLLKKGIQASEDLVALRIPYPKLDRVYYFLAFNHSELGNRKRALSFYRRLIQDFKKSPLRVEAHRELGEDAFKRRKYAKAIEHFKEALQIPSGANLPGVLHKLSWSYYRTRQFDQAVATMKKAITVASENEERFLSIREEALRDMATFMTEQDRVAEALQYFEKVAGNRDFYAASLEKLANDYERRVQIKRAIKVYEALLKASDDEEQLFRVMAKLFDLDLRRGDMNSGLKRLQKIELEDFDQEDTQVAYRNLRAKVRRVATERHEKYRKARRKKKSRENLQTAKRFYTLYRDRFLSFEDKRNEKPEIQMYLAEVETELRNPKEAAGLYQMVIDSEDKRYLKEAVVLQVAVFADLLKKEQSEPNAQALIRSIDQLQRVMPESRQARETALQAAKIQAGRSTSRSDAIGRIRRILEKWSGSTQAITAAKLWIQIELDRLPGVAKVEVSKYRQAAARVSEMVEILQENAPLLEFDRKKNKKRLLSQLNSLEERLEVESIQAFEKSKDFRSAGAAYEDFGDSAKSTRLAARAFSNALDAYLKGNTTEGLMRVSEKQYKRFGATKAVVRSLRQVATHLLIQGNFKESADLFFRLGIEIRDERSALTAARIYQGAGLMERAIETRRLFQKKFPKSKRRWRNQLDLALLYLQVDSSEANEKAKKSLQSCLAGKPTREECGVRLGVLTQSNEVLKRVSKVSKRQKKFSPFVGYARYLLADSLEKSKRFEALTLPDAKLQKSLAERLAFFEELSQAYLRVVDVGGPWAIAALHRLAKWTIGLAQEINQIDPPESADALMREQFRETLANLADPLQRRAVLTWLQAIKKAESLQLLSVAVPEIGDALADRRVKNFRRAQGTHGGYRLDGVSPRDQDQLPRIRKELTTTPDKSALWVQYGNLIWGQKKPILAEIAYEQAERLNPKNASAYNNRAVILLSQEGDRDWYRSAAAAALLIKANRFNRSLLASRRNLGTLLNTYRLFKKALPHWKWVLSKNPDAHAYDGLGTALVWKSGYEEAVREFRQAEKQGASLDRFAARFHRAAWISVEGEKGAEECLDLLDEIDESDLKGFEKDAFVRLKTTCENWKEEGE